MKSQENFCVLERTGTFSVLKWNNFSYYYFAKISNDDVIIKEFYCLVFRNKVILLTNRIIERYRKRLKCQQHCYDFGNRPRGPEGLLWLVDPLHSRPQTTYGSRQMHRSFFPLQSFLPSRRTLANIRWPTTEFTYLETKRQRVSAFDAQRNIFCNRKYRRFI